MEEVISRTLKKIADGPSDEIGISKFDLDYAYNHLQFSKREMNHSIFAVSGGNFTGYYQFVGGVFGAAYIPTISNKNIDQTLENQHPPWLTISLL